MSKEKRKLTKSERSVVTIMLLASVCAIGVFGWLVYVNDYYKATEAARKAMRGSNEIRVVETEGYYLFSDVDEKCENGIIFYPGGKVEETAYAPLMLELAEYGYEVYLVKMPAKLAIFGMNAAENIIEDATHIEEWTMMGHSLGGAMAASYSADHDEQIDKLVLLAAYSTTDLSDKEVEVYSFYGSEDKVLNMEKYESYASNLPEDVIEEVIDGGNHSYYAHYGEQAGDGEATITRQEQQECVLDVFLNFQNAE